MGKRLFVSILIIVFVLILPFLFLNSANLVLGFLGVQETFILDFNNTIFNYTLTKFNDSNTTQEFDFNESGGNQTYYLSIPKNATIQNISMNLTGKLTTIYKQQVSTNELKGISIGNATTYSNNEISVGTKETVGGGKVKLVYGENGSIVWNSELFGNNQIRSTYIGNVTSDSGEEIVVGSEDTKVYLLDSSGSELWNCTTSGEVKSVAIKDLYNDGENEVIAGSDKIYLYDSLGGLIWNTSINNINQLAVGNLTSDDGNEIAVGCNAGWIYILNSTGIVIDSFTIGISPINTLDIGNISSNSGNEIVIGTGDNKIYILNSSGGQIKNYTVGGSINSIRIGEVANDFIGNEIIAGCNDQKLYILNSTGDLIAEFLADNYVNTVDIGDLTNATGNEVVAGGADGYVYAFNFDYFPTNLSIYVGGDSTKDWNCTEEKLRTSETATGGNLVSAINNYLINTCSPDSNNNCQVPLIFSSIFKGKLNISNLNVTYSYNTSDITYHNGSAIPDWSRTNNVEINEEIGYGVYVVNFEGIPAENITINYITVNQSATSCDFNLSSYSTTIINGKPVCDIHLNPIYLIGGESVNLQLFLWDNTMNNATPLSISNTTEYYSTSELDDHNKWINLTFNATNGTFTNATAWWTVNDPEVNGEEFLKVFTPGECNLTPESEQSNCDSAGPTYTQKDCFGDTFYVCKKTVGSNMYFKWKHPSLSTPIIYIAGGSYNLKPNITDIDLTPYSGIWGTNFTFSLNVSDIDGDITNLTLWVFENQTGNWVNKGLKNVGNESVEFNLTSDKNWTGTSRFLFEYFDCNQSNLSQKFHSASNTTIINFNVFEHEISVIYNGSLGSGNNSLVFRNESIFLSVFVNNTNSSDCVEGANCSLWVGGVFANYTQSNASGFCNFNFTPNQNFSLGHSNWKIGIFNDPYYNEGNSTELNITIRGSIHPEITNPINFSFYKNESTIFHARLLNLYGSPAEESGYNCSFYMDNTSTPIGNSSTNSSGGCSLEYNSSSSFNVGQSILIVIINKTGADNYYNISNNQTNKSVFLMGRLNLTILSPLETGSYYKGQNLSINSSVKDNCGQSVGGANVSWYLVNKYRLNVTIEDTSGRDRVNYPIILNGSFFADGDFELIDWKLNNTQLRMDGATIPFSVYPWTSTAKSELNNSRVYLDNLTELVFLINLTASASKTLEINLKDSNPSTNDVGYNILNAGFDSTDFSLWTVSSCDDCVSNVSFENETYFADLSADGGGVELFQNLSNITKTDKINISYKAWGEFFDGTYHGDFQLKIGGVLCGLTPLVNNYVGYNSSEEPWTVATCSGSYSSAENISVILNEYEHEQNAMDMTYAQINYICFVDDDGACVNFHSGNPTQLNLTHRKSISGLVNDTYLLGGTENVGRRKIIADAEKPFYESDSEIRYFNLTGFSYVKNLTIDSDYCTLNSTTGIWQYRCMVNASLSLQCMVADNYTYDGIVDYSVDFYNLTTLYIGNNTTNSQGIAVKESQIYGADTYPFSCNITDQSNIFYNVAGVDSMVVEAIVEGGNTTAELNLTPEYLEASNLTIVYNITQNMTFVLINNGTGDMYSPVINISSIAGIYIQELVCDPIRTGENCTNLFNITITSEADTGNRTIWFNVTWQNGDATYDTVNKNITIFVEPNKQLEFVENSLSLSVPISSDRTTNFTIQNYGNVNLTNAVINLTGDNSSTFINLITFSNNNFNLDRGGEETILMTVNASTSGTSWIGVYNLNITANVSNCLDCLKILPFTLNITPLDWDAAPLTLNKTVGLKAEVNKLGEIGIDNIKDENFDFNLSITVNSGTTAEYLTLNDTNKATQLSITVTNNTERIVEIFYNTSVGPDAVGTYNYTLKVENLDSDAPDFINISIFFEIINFTVDIISPNGTTPVADVNVNDTLELSVRALSGSTSVTENMSWAVLVGGSNCNVVNYSYHSGNELWHINCTAPNVTNNIIENDLKVTGTYEVNGVVLSDLEEDAVIYVDSISPWFSNITADFINNNTYTQDYITFEVNITDNKNISSVNAKVTHTNSGQSWNLGLSNYTETYLSAENEFDKRNFVFNFSRPEYTGDYDIIVYANDTTAGNVESNKTGWFDIYIPVQVSGNLIDPDGIPIDANFTFYREGCDLDELYRIHENNTKTSEIYNWTLHKRKYDVKVDLFGQEIVLRDADFNNSNNTNNPFKFDYYPNYTSLPLVHAGLPNTVGTVLLGIVIETNLTENVDFTIDFEQALASAIIAGKTIKNVNNLEVLVCHDWNYAAQQCNSSSDYLDRNFDPSGNVFEFNTSELSAFIIAESCYSGESLIDCSGYYYTPPVDPGTSSPSGSSSGGTTTIDLEISTCGDGVCEVGENYQNCPQDCPLDDFPLIVDTNLANVRIFQGDSRNYQLSLKSRMSSDIDTGLEITGTLKEILSLGSTRKVITPDSTEEIPLYLTVPLNQSTGIYTGNIVIKARDQTKNVPISITVLEKATAVFSVELELATKEINPGDNLEFLVKLINLGEKKLLPINLTYIIKEQKTGKVVSEVNTSVILETTKIVREDIPLDITEKGFYNLEVWAIYYDRGIMDVETFEVVRPLFESPWMVGLILMALLTGIIVGGTYIWRYYLIWKKEKEKEQRYLYPLDYKKVPREGFKIGKFAGTDNYCYFDPKDLTTHLISAGATGAGKSVSASVIAEEALDKNIPVIVFDPTAQWTGFVKACKDSNLTRKYKEFGMSDFDIKSYPGLIYDVEKPDFELKIKEFINSGEITIFCLNKLKPGEYDKAVDHIIKSIFGETWEESSDLKLLLVFDEVHRLLEKYGGTGGYVALEKAAREFRKWGIGIIMCSQVLADFKSAISGNVLTEIQLNTKSLVDIEKVKTKYGEQYSQRITRMGVGAGLMQYPKYNDGKPFFVEFRPTKHDPHKITEAELSLYKTNIEKLKVIEAKIKDLKERKIYTEDYELDFKLAMKKLKTGNFRMVEIYITSLEKSLEKV